MMISKKIKELRQARGWSLRHLGELIGVDASAVWHWENGTCDPLLFSCILLADAFNVSLDELVGRDFKGVSRMTDKDIIKTLEHCTHNEYCNGCPYYEKDEDCLKGNFKDILDLINLSFSA